MTAAALAAFWCAIQVGSMQRARGEVERLQTQVAQASPAVERARASIQGRERIAAVRAAVGSANAERAAISRLMTSVAAASRSGAALDSIGIMRVSDGFQAMLFCHVSAQSGPAAMSAATGFYRHFQNRQDLKELEFQSSYAPRVAAATTPAGEELRFTVSFLAPLGEGQ
jgi:predicted DsbA family dithiol-disulfide isomerase